MPCAQELKSSKCKSCKKTKNLYNKKYLNHMMKCIKCKSKITRKNKKCDLKDYITYPGAEIGECKY